MSKHTAEEIKIRGILLQLNAADALKVLERLAEEYRRKARSKVYEAAAKYVAVSRANAKKYTLVE